MRSPTAALAGKGNTTGTPFTASKAVMPPASSDAALAAVAAVCATDVGAAGGVVSTVSVLLTVKDSRPLKICLTANETTPSPSAA